MQVATISSKRQLTISNELLSLFGIKPGSRVILHNQKEGVLISPLKGTVVDETAGSLTRYIPISKRNIPFEKILKETKKIIVRKLVKSL